MTAVTTRIRKFLVWIGAFAAVIALLMGGIFALLIVVDEASYWRSLVRDGDYQRLDAIFSEIEGDFFNPFKPMAWYFTRAIRHRFQDFPRLRESLSFSAVEKRAPPGTACPEVGAETDRLILSQAPRLSSGVLAPSSGANLCEIEYRVTNRDFGANVILIVEEIPAAETGKGALKIKFGEYAFLKPGQSHALSVRVGRPDGLPRTYRLLAVAGQRVLLGPMDWITAARTDAEVQDLIRRAERLGLVIVAGRHAVKE